MTVKEPPSPQRSRGAGVSPPLPGRRLEEEGARLRGVPPSTQAAEPYSRDRADRDRRRGRRPLVPGRPRRPAKPTKKDVKAEVDKLYEEAEQATEKYNGAKEQPGEAPEGGRRASRTRSPAARVTLNQLRKGLGPMASGQYRSGSIDPSVQLFLSARPGQLPRQGRHPRPVERQAGRAAEEDRRTSSARLAQAARRGREQARGPRRHPQGARREEERDQGQARQGAGAAQHPDGQGARRSCRPRRTAPTAAPRRVDLGSDVPASQRGLRAALSAAQAKIGSPYVWGATGPASFDCSGLTRGPTSRPAQSLPRTSQAQANAGTRISRRRTQARRPGALLRRPAPRRPVRGQRPGPARPQAGRGRRATSRSTTCRSSSASASDHRTAPGRGRAAPPERANCGPRR